MLRLLSDETPVHGVKETYHAKGRGKAFWLMIFAACLIAMVLQLRGLFGEYFKANIGTNVKGITSTDTKEFEAPNFYYCNMPWLPNIKETTDFVCRKDNINDLHDMITECERCVNGTYLQIHWEVNPGIDRSGIWGNAIPIQCDPDPAFCYSYRHHQDSFLIEYHVDEMVVKTHLLKLLPYHFPDFVSTNRTRGIGELIRRIQRDHNGSLSQFLKHVTVIDTPQGRRPISTIREIVTNDAGDYFQSLAGSEPGKRYVRSLEKGYQQLFKPQGEFAINMDGVCWKVKSSAKNIDGDFSARASVRHVVVHYGALAYQLRAIAAKHNISGALENFFYSVQFHGRNDYATYAAIADPSSTNLYFPQAFRLDTSTPFVRVQYWTKKTLRFPRKGEPCRGRGWTRLDQAHCIQTGAFDAGTNALSCRQYLPASKYYQETVLDKDICITNRQVQTWDAWATLFATAIPEHSINVSSPEIGENISKLTQNSEECPQPCSEIAIDFQVHYRRSEININSHPHTRTWDMDYIPCLFVMAELLHEVTNATTVHDLAHVIDLILEQWRQSSGIQAHMTNTIGGYNLAKWYPACSVVEYVRSEMHGFVVEEYRLHTLSDLGSSLGGTLGLWMGASVVSLVQALYICWLRGMFDRMNRYFEKIKSGDKASGSGRHNEGKYTNETNHSRNGNISDGVCAINSNVNTGNQNISSGCKMNKNKSMTNRNNDNNNEVNVHRPDHKDNKRNV